MLGAPDHIRAWSRIGPEGTDENTGMIFGYDSGAVAALTCGIVGATPVAATITGTDGRIELPGVLPRDRLHRAPATTAPIEVVDLGPEAGSYQYEAIEVQRCLARGSSRARWCRTPPPWRSWACSTRCGSRSA